MIFFKFFLNKILNNNNKNNNKNNKNNKNNNNKINNSTKFYFAKTILQKKLVYFALLVNEKIFYA